jgi:hypothetical protein
VKPKAGDVDFQPSVVYSKFSNSVVAGRFIDFDETMYWSPYQSTEDAKSAKSQYGVDASPEWFNVEEATERSPSPQLLEVMAKNLEAMGSGGSWVPFQQDGQSYTMGMEESRGHFVLFKLGAQYCRPIHYETTILRLRGMAAKAEAARVDPNAVITVRASKDDPDLVELAKRMRTLANEQRMEQLQSVNLVNAKMGKDPVRGSYLDVVADSLFYRYYYSETDGEGKWYDMQSLRVPGTPDAQAETAPVWYIHDLRESDAQKMKYATISSIQRKDSLKILEDVGGGDVLSSPGHFVNVAPFEGGPVSLAEIMKISETESGFEAVLAPRYQQTMELETSGDPSDSAIVFQIRRELFRLKADVESHLGLLEMRETYINMGHEEVEALPDVSFPY